MFCSNCGKQVPDERLYCEECEAAMNPDSNAARQEPETLPVTPDPAESPAINEVGSISFDLNTGDGEKPGKKKKTGVIALGIALAAVLVAALLVVFNLSAIKSFYNRTFLSPEEYLMTVEKDALADSVSSGYGKYLDTLESAITNAVVEMHLKVGDDVLSLLESASGMGDLSWLSDIMLNVSANQNKGRTQYDLVLGLKSTEIAAIRMIMDMTDADNGMVYLGLPELAEQYLSVNLSLMAGSSASLMAQQVTANDLMKLLPDEATFNTLLERYADLILSQIVNVKKDTKTVSCGGASQDVTVLTSTATAEELAQILVTVFETMTEDAELRAIVENAEDALVDFGVAADNLYDSFRDMLDAAVEEMKEADTDNGNYATLVTYVDYQGNIVGRNLTLTTDDDDTEVFQYLSLTEGDKVGFTLEIPEGDVEIEGEGTRNGDKLNAVYELSVDGLNLGKLELEDVITTDEMVSGIYKLRPSSEIIEAMFGSTDLPAGLMGDALALVFEIESTQKTSELVIRLTTGGSALISLECTGKALASADVLVPSNAIDVNDTVGLAEFVTSLDFNKLVSSMEEAGVPADLVSIVQYYVSSITSALSYNY